MNIIMLDKDNKSVILYKYTSFNTITYQYPIMLDKDNKSVILYKYTSFNTITYQFYANSSVPIYPTETNYTLLALYWNTLKI